MPDRRACEAVHLCHAERRGRARRVREPLGRPPTHALGLAVAPYLRGQDPFGAVRRWGRRRPARPGAHRAPSTGARAAPAAPGAAPLAGVGERCRHVEVVAPARELEAVVAPAFRLCGELGERQVGPLAGKERDRSGHAPTLRGIQSKRGEDCAPALHDPRGVRPRPRRDDSARRRAWLRRRRALPAARPRRPGRCAVARRGGARCRGSSRAAGDVRG